MNIDDAFSSLGKTLKTELLTTFREIVVNYRERRWEPSELNGGKLCEIVYSIIKGITDKKMPNKASKPKNMLDACKAMEQTDVAFPRSVRIQIPRTLVFLYEIRNNRNVGHVGGDVDPNSMDARVVLETSKWIMAELARIFHSLSMEEASALVESITERTLPIVWQHDDIRRVLDTSLSRKDQSLLLLYSTTGATNETDLFNWVEATNAANFRRDVIRPLHNARFVEYNESKREIVLTPLGIQYVETNLPLEWNG